MFEGASAFNQFIGNWNTQNVSTMCRMFRNATSFNQDIGVWDTSSVTIMESMFNGASKFNQAIGDWDTLSLINIRDMFLGASEFNQPLGGWDTSSVRNMMGVFKHANSFDQDLSDWNFSAVQFTGDGFLHGTAISEIKKGLIHESFASNPNWAYDWRQYVVIDDSNFHAAINLWFDNQAEANATYGHISDWNTSAVTDMSNAFDGRTTFNEDIGRWT